ncbi:MAG: SdrD B-like domain-containing protein, partial [Candidatus Kariarchaeaceae archaeon]
MKKYQILVVLIYSFIFFINVLAINYPMISSDKSLEPDPPELDSEDTNPVVNDKSDLDFEEVVPQLNSLNFTGKNVGYYFDTNSKVTVLSEEQQNTQINNPKFSLMNSESSSAAIWTDKADYNPGEIVTVFGSGFNADSNIEVNITRPNEDVDTGFTTSNSTGDFIYYYDLNGILGEYNVTATDGVNYANTTLNNKWIGSILGSSNSEYREAMSVPQRIILTDISNTAGNIHTLTFSVLATKGGIHAYDFLTGWNQGNDPPLGYDPCGINFIHTTQAVCEALQYSYPSSNNISVDVPDDPFISQHGFTQAKINAYELAYENRQINITGNKEIFSANLTLSHDKANYSDTGDSYIDYTLTWDSSSDQILIKLAGHLSLSGNNETNEVAWGEGLGASYISGGPYHFKLKQLDGASLGSQDNQIKSSAILPAETIFSGYKWHDLNGDGIWDGGEPGLSNWNITLSNATSGKIVDWTLTNGTGYYNFSILGIGKYWVNETLQANWTQTSPFYIVGSATEDQFANGYNFTATGGQNYLNYNFSNFHWLSVTGQKWHDLDGNSTWDNGEPTLSNWNITLWNATSSEMIDSTFTNSTGHYELIIKGAGSYWVNETLQANWIQTYPIYIMGSDTLDLVVSGHSIDSVTSGADVGNKNFGNFQGLTVSGYKWHDLDGDGVWDLSEPALSNWNITLWNATSNQMIGSTFTNGSGYYEFSIIDGGSYWVNETLQANWTQTSPYYIVGSATEDQVVNGYSFTVTGGQNQPNNNFSNFRWFDVSGYKWNDTDGDGSWDAGETPLVNWNITLWNATSGDMLDDYLTLIDGSYYFTIKDGGAFYVNESLQAQWTQTSPYYIIGSDAFDQVVAGHDFIALSGTELTNYNFSNFQW